MEASTYGDGPAHFSLYTLVDQGVQPLLTMLVWAGRTLEQLQYRHLSMQ